MERSFEKNVKERKERNVLLKRTDAPLPNPGFTVSLVVPVEIWKSTNPFPPVLAAHTVIFSLVLLNRSKFISFWYNAVFSDYS